VEKMAVSEVVDNRQEEYFEIGLERQKEEGKRSGKFWREREFCEKWTVEKWCWLEEVKRRMTLRCRSGRRTRRKERSWSRKGIERGNEEVESVGSSESRGGRSTVDFLEGVEIEKRDEVLEEKLGKGKKRKRKEDEKERKKGLSGLPG
jgi:hypothetical protein